MPRVSVYIIGLFGKTVGVLFLFPPPSIPICQTSRNVLVPLIEESRETLSPQSLDVPLLSLETKQDLRASLGRV